MIAFRDSTETVTLEATDFVESKASGEECMVRTLNVEHCHQCFAMLKKSAAYLLLRSNMKRLAPDRTIYQATNG